jgi:hypothetical protein
MKSLRRCIAAACLLACGTAVQAGIQASASFTQIAFTTVDLNPGDGVDAAYTFVGPMTSYIDLGVSSATRPGVLSDLELSGSSPATQLHGAITADSLRLEAAVSDAGSGGFTARVGTGGSPFVGNDDTWLSLAPYTSLHITGMVELHAHSTIGIDCDLTGAQPPCSRVLVVLNVASGAGFGGGGWSVSAPNSEHDFSMPVDIEFLNHTDHELQSPLAIQLYLGGLQVRPIPEPSTGALWALGLAALGLRGRFRRAARAC